MKVVKIEYIIITILCMVTIFASNTYKVNAAITSGVEGGSTKSDISKTMTQVGNGNVKDAGGFLEVIKKVLGLLRILTGLLSIIVIAYTGFEMITETPEGKKKIKEKMVPIVIGVVLVFMATTISAFIISVFENNTSNNSGGGGTSYEATY